jgi:hypothetical protein
LAEQRTTRLDDAGLEEAEQFGVAFFFDEQGAEDGQRGSGLQVFLEVLQDRQGEGAGGGGVGGRVFDPERADHGRREFRLVLVAAAEAGDVGAGGGRHRVQRHAGVAEFAELASGGGQDGPVEGRIPRPSGSRQRFVHYIMVPKHNVNRR